MGKSSSRQKGQSSEKEDLVLTPGGWRPKSTVFRVKPGQHVEMKDGRLKVICTATGEVIADQGEIPETEAENSRPSGSKVSSRKRIKKPIKREE